MGPEGSHQIYPLSHRQGQPQRLDARSGRRTGRNAGGVGRGMKTESRRPHRLKCGDRRLKEARNGGRGRTWMTRDGPSWSRKTGGQEGRDGGD